MALTGGPTVTLLFKGDTDDLERSIERVQTWVTRIGIAGAAVAGVAAAGAAAAALAVAGLPLLFAGIGIAAAAQSEKVKAAFTSLKDHVVAQAQAMAAPFEPILVGIAQRAQATFDRIGPSLSRIFSDVAPMVDRLATAVMKFVEGAMPGFEKAIDNAKPVIEALARGIEKLGPAIGDFFAKISTQSGPAAEAMDGLFNVITWLVGVLGDALAFCLKWKDVLIPLGLTVASVAAGIKLVTLAVKAWEVAQVALDLVLMANPIGVVIAVIAALAAGVIYCYQHFESFRNIVDGAWAGVKAATEAAVNGIRTAIQWLSEVPDKVGGWFGTARDRARDAVNAIPGHIRDMVTAVFNAILGLGSLPEKVAEYWEGVKRAIIDKVGQIVGVVTEFVGHLIDAILAPVKRFYDAGASLMQSFADGIASKQQAAQDAGIVTVQGLDAALPQSPAKVGPFSGSGYTFDRGVKMMEDFGRGISEAAPKLAQLARSAMEGAHIAMSGFTSPGSGGSISGSAPGLGSIDLKVAPGVDSALSSLLMNLVRTGQLQLQRAGL